MSKRKSVAMLDSSSDSDSDLSDSEFQKIAKKRKKSPEVEKSRSRSISRSSSRSNSLSRSRSRSRSSSSSAAHSDRDDDKDEAAEAQDKSSDVEDGEVSDSDSDVGEFDDGLDDELMGDEEDRKRLEMMNEKEREEEIFKRAEKREMMKKRYEIEKKLKLQRKSTKEEMKSVNKALDTKERSRARKEAVENKKDKKSMALDVLKAKRKEKQEQQQKIEEKKKKEKETEQKKWKTNDIYSSDSSDDEIERARSRSPERRRSRSSSSSSSSSSSASSRSRSPTPVRRERETIKSHEDLEKMRFTRSKLERWCHLPLFDEVVTGGFVRILIGENNDGRSVYRVAEVLGVIEGSKIYKLNNTRTNKTLKLRYAQQERPFRMEYVSQSTFTDKEFIKWREDTMLAGLAIPTMEEAESKKKQIQKFHDRRLTNKDIQHMLQEKERFMQNPRNYAMYKSKLSKDRDAALADGNYEESDRLSQKLADLEERAENLDKARSEKISTIALINDRNRKDNIAKAEVNIKAEIERKKLEGETSDPFTRRKTKPTLATAVIARKMNALATGTEIPKPVRNITKDTSIRLTGKGSENSSAGGDDKKENDPEAKTKDLFTAHDFDIDINLDSYTPNSAIKMNLTPVITSKPGIGPKKSLNLSDYKKKRGLI